MSVSYAEGVNPDTYLSDGRAAGIALALGGGSMTYAGLLLDLAPAWDYGKAFSVSGLAIAGLCGIGIRKQNRKADEAAASLTGEHERITDTLG